MDNNHLLDIIRLIYNIQENITDNSNILNSCTRPMLGPIESFYNTRPITLYLCNNINIISVAFLVSSTYLVMFLHRIYYINKYKLLERRVTEQ